MKIYGELHSYFSKGLGNSFGLRGAMSVPVCQDLCGGVIQLIFFVAARRGPKISRARARNLSSKGSVCLKQS